MFPLPNGLVRCKSGQEPDGNVEGLTIVVDRCLNRAAKDLICIPSRLDSGRTQTDRRPTVLASVTSGRGQRSEKMVSGTKCGKTCRGFGAWWCGEMDCSRLGLHDERSIWHGALLNIRLASPINAHALQFYANGGGPCLARSILRPPWNEARIQLSHPLRLFRQIGAG